MGMKLETLPAKKGDCLIVHCGSNDAPAIILVDGGPAGVWTQTLRPRLIEIRKERGLGDGTPLPIDLVVVSHVDDDHINGIVAMFEDMMHRRQRHDSQLVSVGRLWHNSFDDIIGNDETRPGGGASFGAASAEPGGYPDEGELLLGDELDAAKVLASVAQGDRLRKLACELGIPVNPEFGGLIQTSVAFEKDERLGIEIAVAGPLQTELGKLQADFDAWLLTNPKRKTRQAVLAALDDESVANLSSIVLLLRDGERSLLLTGDARSDKVVMGLVEAGEMEPEGILEVDILKMPHHGSIRNIDPSFLRSVMAREYVLSGDGKHGNPDRETIDHLLAERPGAEITLVLTYPIDIIDAERKREHAKEQQKRVKKGKLPGRDWSDGLDALATVLLPPPYRVTVTVVQPG
jgi:hypothetical protein